jgi:hypothetical protein
MAGIEAAGLALAIFPIVTQTLDWYGGILTGRDIRDLADSLRNNEQIFLDSVESLLRSAVPAAQVDFLLSAPDGESWKNGSLRQSVSDQLGVDAARLFKNVDTIHIILRKLNEKLPVRQRKP